MAIEQKSCVPCKGGVPPLNSDQIETYRTETPGWRVIDDNKRLQRRFEFKDFSSSLNFVNLIGNLAENEGHHPDSQLGWGYVEIFIFTHKINGLHENDFILASKINLLSSNI